MSGYVQKPAAIMKVDRPFQALPKGLSVEIVVDGREKSFVTRLGGRTP